MRNARLRCLVIIGGFCLWLAHPASGADAAATPATNAVAGAAPARTEGNSGADEVLRGYLRLQEQIHEAQLAIERNRQESEDGAAKSAKMVADRLQVIEQSLAEQRVSELEAVQHANHTVLIVVSGFAALGCVAVLLTAYFQWRAVNRFTAMSSARPVGLGLGASRAMAALESGQHSLATLNPVEQSTARLLGAIERLEKRIQELERTSQSPLNDAAAASNILDLQSPGGAPAAEPSAGSAEKAPEITSLLGKGQSLLNLAKLDEAIACFDEVLAQDPDNTEALVKKGTALERLRKPQEALECYDRAIAADNLMTIAYLYKGGLYNRMERFNEALECYEQALHTQEKRRAS